MVDKILLFFFCTIVLFIVCGWYDGARTVDTSDFFFQFFIWEGLAVDSKPIDETSRDDSNEAAVENEAVETNEMNPLEVLQLQLAQLDARGRSGADWFFWIAALSLINSVILLSGGDTHFVVGLGVTLVADVIAKSVAEQQPEIAGTARAVAFVFDLLVAGVMCSFGWLSRRGVLPVFALGMFLYLLDGLIYVLIGDWLSVGFHAFVLFGMWGGFMAYRQMKTIKAGLEQQLAAGFVPEP